MLGSSHSVLALASDDESFHSDHGSNTDCRYQSSLLSVSIGPVRQSGCASIEDPGGGDGFSDGTANSPSNRFATSCASCHLIWPIDSVMPLMVTSVPSPTLSLVPLFTSAPRPTRSRCSR